MPIGLWSAHRPSAPYPRPELFLPENCFCKKCCHLAVSWGITTIGEWHFKQSIAFYSDFSTGRDLVVITWQTTGFWKQFIRGGNGDQCQCPDSCWIPNSSCPMSAVLCTPVITQQSCLKSNRSKTMVTEKAALLPLQSCSTFYSKYKFLQVSSGEIQTVWCVLLFDQRAANMKVSSKNLIDTLARVGSDFLSNPRPPSHVLMVVFS